VTNSLLRFKKNQRYVLFDFETEGLNLVSSRPWQLAWLVAEGEKIVAEHDRFLSFDDLRVSEAAAAITGFNEQAYRSKAEDPAKVVRDFLNDIMREDTLILGHNILGFDVYILNSLCNSLGIELDPSYIDRCVDTLSLAKAIHLNLEYNNNTSLIEWQYKLCNLHKRGLKVSMQKLLEKYDIYHTEGMLHNAVYDINMNFKIFRKQLWEIEV
jgi:DNA polymerase III epsilon subunit-like protein